MANTINQILKIQRKLDDPPIFLFTNPQVWREKLLKRQMDLFLQVSNQDIAKANKYDVSACAKLFKSTVFNQWEQNPYDIKLWFKKSQLHFDTLDKEYAKPFIIEPNQLLETLFRNRKYVHFPEDMQRTLVEYVFQLPGTPDKYGNSLLHRWVGLFDSLVMFDYLLENNQLEQYAPHLLSRMKDDYHADYSDENRKKSIQNLLVLRDLVLKKPELFSPFVSAATHFSDSLYEFFSMEQLHDLLNNIKSSAYENEGIYTTIRDMQHNHIKVDPLLSPDQRDAYRARIAELSFYCRYTANKKIIGYSYSYLDYDPDKPIWTSQQSALAEEDYDTVVKWTDDWIKNPSTSLTDFYFANNDSQAHLRLVRTIFSNPELCARLIHDKESAERWIKAAHFLYARYITDSSYEHPNSPFFPDHDAKELRPLIQKLWIPFINAAKKDPSIVPMILDNLPCEHLLDPDYFAPDFKAHALLLSDWLNHDRFYSIDQSTLSHPKQHDIDRQHDLRLLMYKITTLYLRYSNKDLPPLHTLLQNTHITSHPEDLRYLFDQIPTDTINWSPILLELAAQFPDKSQWQDDVQKCISHMKERPTSVRFSQDLPHALTQWIAPEEAKEILYPVLKQESIPFGNPEQYVSQIREIFATDKTPQRAHEIFLHHLNASLFSYFPEHFRAIWKEILTPPGKISQEELLKYIDRFYGPYSLGTYQANIHEILKYFPEDLELRKKITDKLSENLKAMPIQLQDLDRLHACVKDLMIGKTHKDKSELAPQLQLLSKMRFLTSTEAKYFTSRHIHIPPEQDVPGMHLLNENFPLYHKVFTYLVEQQAKDADPDYLAPLADSVAQIFGKNSLDYLKHVLPYTSSVAAAANFLPSRTKLDAFSQEQKDSLAQWLMGNAIYPVNGKFLMRPADELQLICSKWRHLSQEEMKLPYKELYTVVQAKTTYDNVTEPKFAIEAMKAGVCDELYSYAEDFWKAAKQVPEAFDSSVTFTAEGLTGRFLPRSDPRSISFGQYTDCCQYLENAGRPCAVSSAIDPFAGCFVLEDDHHQIVAGSFVWKTNLEDGGVGVCFDNVEALGGYNKKPVLNAIYEQASQYLIQQGAKIVTVGKGCSDMMLSSYPKAQKLLEQNIYKGYSDAKSEQCVLAQTDMPVQVQDHRVPFYTRPLLVAYPKDERQTIRSTFPDQDLSALSHKIPLNHRTVLIDKDGYTQGFAFANPENNIISIAIRPEFQQQQPQALTALWNSLVPSLSSNNEQTSWAIAMPNESSLALVQELQQQKLINFETPKEAPTYPATVNVTVLSSSQGLLIEALKESKNLPQKVESGKQTLPAKPPLLILPPNQPQH